MKRNIDDGVEALSKIADVRTSLSADADEYSKDIMTITNNITDAAAAISRILKHYEDAVDDLEKE